MFFANKRENPDPYYGILDLLKKINIFKLKIVEFTYKISKMNSLVFHNFLKPVSHQYNTIDMQPKVILKDQWLKLTMENIHFSMQQPNMGIGSNWHKIFTILFIQKIIQKVPII